MFISLTDNILIFFIFFILNMWIVDWAQHVHENITGQTKEKSTRNLLVKCWKCAFCKPQICRNISDLSVLCCDTVLVLWLGSGTKPSWLGSEKDSVEAQNTWFCLPEVSQFTSVCQNPDKMMDMKQTFNVRVVCRTFHSEHRAEQNKLNSSPFLW